MKKYPSLYNIVRKKNVTVAKVLGTSPLNISFRPGLVGDNFAKWFELVGNIIHVQLYNRKDYFTRTTGKT